MRLLKRGLTSLVLAAGLLFSSCSSIPQHRAVPKSAMRLEEKLSRHEEANNKLDKYAVLIVGSPEPRFEANISIVQKTLLVNGYPTENIYIFDRAASSGELYESDGLAMHRNLEQVFLRMKKVIDGKDTFVVGYIGHGNKGLFGRPFAPPMPYSEVELALDETLTQAQLKRYLAGIKPKKGIISIDSCHSGGFAKTLGKGPYIAISSSQQDQPAWGRTADSFSTYLFTGLRYYDRTIDSDDNKQIGVGEAYQHAIQQHKETKNGVQIPVIESEVDPRTIYLQE